MGQILTTDQLEARKREAMQLIEETRDLVDLHDTPREVRCRAIWATVDEIRLNTFEGWFEMTGALGINLHRLDGSAVIRSVA